MSTAGVFTGICEPDNHKCAGDGNHCYHGYNPVDDCGRVNFCVKVGNKFKPSIRDKR